MIIIGITGTFGAGKGAIVDYLVKKKGFTHYSVRQFLTDELVKRGLPLVRDNMHDLSNELRQKYGPGYMVEKALEKARSNGGDAVIEALRSVGEVETLKKADNSFMIAIDADIKTRYQRILKRKSSTDHISFEKFVQDEAKEMESDKPWSQNVKKCSEMSDYIIKNDSTMSDLYKQVDGVLSDISNR